MRLFRQSDPFDYDGPVARMAAELSRAADRPAGPWGHAP
jgi:hypothetical protein